MTLMVGLGEDKNRKRKKHGFLAEAISLFIGKIIIGGT